MYCCCRGHTGKASDEHVKAGGKEWDTCKPLHKWFKHLHRVLLMDDDAYKVSHHLLLQKLDAQCACGLRQVVTCPGCSSCELLAV